MDPLVIAVILNTNRREDTLEVLQSLEDSDYQNQRVIVLDNASTDGSVGAIHDRFPNVQVISLSSNTGYAGNNNVGIREALSQNADWILVLNEDTTLKSDCLRKMIEVGETNPRYGILGPLVYHHSDPTTIQSAGGWLGEDWRGWHLGQDEQDCNQYSEPHLVDWVSGCAIMLRRGMIDEIGMLDERFFYYYEETEWCLRARKHGWLILNIPAAKMWHKGVQPNYQPSPNVTYYATRNHFLMLAKHKAPLRTWFLAWLETGKILATWTMRSRWRMMKDHRDAMWHGTVDFLRGRWGMRRV